MRADLSGCRFQVLKESRDNAESPVPGLRLVNIDAQFRQRSVGSLRPAALQQADVARHERLSLIEITLVQRQRQQFAKRIRIAIEPAVDEVGDIAPSPTIGGNHLDALPEEF